MDGKPSDIVDFKAMALEGGGEGQERKVEDVLVIGGIEFEVGDEFTEIGEFQGCPSSVFQKDRNASEEVVDVRSMGENVVAKDEIRFPVLGGDFRCCLHTEELAESGDTDFFCDFGDIFGRFDTQARYAGRDEVLEQIAVVAGDLCDEAFVPEIIIFDVAFDCGRGVPEHGIGERGEVEVFLEEIDRGNGFGDLHQTARRADRQAEGEFRFGFPEVGFAEKIVCQRLAAEVEELLDPGGVAAATLVAGSHWSWGKGEAHGISFADAFASYSEIWEAVISRGSEGKASLAYQEAVFSMVSPKSHIGCHCRR